MFSTEAPCGDASMEILMSEIGAEESVPWNLPDSCASTSAEGSFSAKSLQGRGFFSNLGAVRRKPSRADAEPTLSKSCTDKLSVREVTSLLSFPIYHFIAVTPNAYLSSLILPAIKYSGKGFTRAFSPNGRLSAIQGKSLPDGYSIHPFKIKPLTKDFQPNFPFSKPLTTTIVLSSSSTPSDQPNREDPPTKANQKTKATNLSALYIHNPLIPSHPNDASTAEPVTETLLNGVQQGYTITSLSTKKASVISRFRMLQLGREIARSLLLLSDAPDTTGTDIHIPTSLPSMTHETVIAGWRNLVEATTYAEAKRAGEIALNRERAKKLVTGVLVAAAGVDAARARDDAEKVAKHWPRNEGDDDWGLSGEEDGAG